MKAPRGYLMLLAIVFGAIFFTVLGALSSYVLTENKLQNAGHAQARALSIAEAGLEYYRWFLAHYPNDLQNGTGVAGPYSIPYNDPEGGVTGTISLAITGNTSCGQVTSVDITSTGTANGSPSATRAVYARYAQPSVARYSYILNDSVWAGADRVINGPYHSNGGIRMDGTANSSVTSSLSNWNCTSDYGCSPASSSASGVVGNGPNQDLWSWPVPQVNFAGIAADFGTLKTLAQAQGIYYPRWSTTNNPNTAAYWHGYHLIFNSNGTVTVRRTTSTTRLDVTPVNSADDDEDRALINNETNYETRTIPATCGLIFVEDHVWIEGTIPQKVTVVAANVVNAGIAPNAYLKNNIVYGATDGTDGLTVIAEHNVLVTPDSPNTMTLNGIFIAQGGAFGRNYYGGSYDPRGTLTILGTTVSNKRTGTKWCLNGSCTSYGGYANRIDSYDRRLANDPPPFTPLVSTDYEFVEWREK
ncbi:MAG: hypothetical protein KBD05_03005 [Candidatus Pacebacteria bacterium]|nr:hypothetical protein [Candidatus Paceibacterota bacterium]